ncbi:hypothetical protein GQ53DRAFT_887638 [Thozetella sp. PMI_491]|nr:hypothetical protein GQ53DRAFT_887638 [Thozetella sp. PMI_491]
MDGQPISNAPARKRKRVSRACTFCHSRKTRCELTNNKPPCRRCLEEDQECVLASFQRNKSKTGQLNRQGYRDVDPSGRLRSPTALQRTPSQTRAEEVTQSIASTDLINPSDALSLLALVADHDRACESNESEAREERSAEYTGEHDTTELDHEFPPLTSGLLTMEAITRLLNRYYEYYHPYFPIAHKDVFYTGRLSRTIRKEPHLLTALLMVATKDDPALAREHEACAAHMESLIAQLICKGSLSVGATEALLIMAEWVPRPPEGELATTQHEDQVAWMQIGVAVRLGYLQGLEQTGFSRDRRTRPESFDRKRLAWAACYMSDRQISILLGNRFWARGPAHGSSASAEEFPSLAAQKNGSENLGLFFQGQLELTQLFSNVHDILYSSKRQREDLARGGGYAKYIDDFTASLRRWKLDWGSLGFTPHSRASLILSYDFLRLYVNVSAFQATVDRYIARTRQNRGRDAQSSSFLAEIAMTPDSRFIQESIDAAHSLLGTINSLVNPDHGLNCMPLKYYLYTVHAAVFLFKAKAVGAIRGGSGESLNRTINATIERLRQSLPHSDSIGNRYARFLSLLWKGGTEKLVKEPRDMTPDIAMELEQLNEFSWRDLDSLGQFINNGMGGAESVITSPRHDPQLHPSAQHVSLQGWQDPFSALG